MRRLARSDAHAPVELGRYDHRQNSWDRGESGKTPISSEDKQVVREALARWQLGLCAYCEGVSGRHAHIEHFRRRAMFPKLTFMWGNLFLSCGNRDRCGSYKDTKGKSYEPNDLIKPDEEDPNNYLKFWRSGLLEPRASLSPRAQRRASETIRVFNLNCPKLRSLRRLAIDIFLQSEPGLFTGLTELDEDDRLAYLDAVLEKTDGEAHATAIRHIFEDV